MSRWPGRIISKNPATPGGSAPYASAPGIWTLPEMAYWKKQGLWPDASADAYWGYVSYLMATSSLSNGNNNLFVDSSGAFNPVSRSGNTTQGAVTPYGTLWSNYFDGSSYITMASGTAAGTGDFTVEGWFNLSSYSTEPMLYDTRPNSTNGAYPAVFVSTSGYLSYYVNTAVQIQGATAVSFNTWNHFAVCRSGTSTRLFLNGVQQGSTYTDTNNYQMGASRPIVGGNGYIPGGASQLTGYVSNLRVVNGTALYTTAFTPPTSPLTAVSGTVLLTCQGNRFRDASTNNAAVSVTGAARVTPYSPFVLNAPGAVYNQSDISYWSGYFNGSGVISAPANSAFDFGTGNFTMECWVCPTATTTVYLMGQAASNDYAPVLLYLTSGRPGIAVSPANGTWTINAAVADALVLNAWTHLAVVRNGNKWSIYVNGVENVIAASTAVTPYTSTDPMAIGGEGVPGLNYPLYGYVSDARIVKGTAVYTSNFTPPTTPLTAISGTSLLTCQNAAFTDNSTNKFVVTATGTTTTTGNNPYQSGYYGNYFDGSGDYITAPANAAFALGSGDFTLECWVYNNEVTRNVGYAGVWSTSYILYREATVYKFYYNGPAGSPLTSSIAAVANAWTHLAVVRNGSTLTFYVNGAVGATTNVGTTAISNGSTQPFHIGTNQDNPSVLGVNGYMSNLRLVKGTAVYTSAFTPPTAPLTAISGTSLLACQANRLIDSSSNAFTLTKVGDTSVSPFDPFYTATIASNGGSMYFDGGANSLTSVSPSFAFGTGAWTVEFWVYPLAYGGSVCGGQLFGTTNGGQSGYSINLGQDINNFRLISNASGAWADNLSAGTGNGPPLNAWSHMVVVRSGANISIYKNGTRVATTASASSWNFSGTTGIVGRFSDGPNVRDLNAYVSNLRVTGAAVYDPTQSTISVPTAPLTPSANTTLLLNGMNAGTYDAGMQNNLETVGSAQVSSAQAKYGTTSVYFDGSGDVLTAPTIPSYTLGTGNFTIEFWINATASGVYQPVISYRNSGVVSAEPDFFVWNTNVGVWYVNGTAVITGTTNLSTAGWTHIAICRSSGSTRMFVNGVQEGSTYADTNNYLPANTSLKIGGLPGASLYFTGYLDDVRITRGYARYTANFTPPTAALPIY